jgi:hypothetical protein
MRPGFHFIYVVCCLAFVLLFTVHLRLRVSHYFYKLRSAQTRQSQLKQTLWQKQLQFDLASNPATLSQKMQPQRNSELTSAVRPDNSQPAPGARRTRVGQAGESRL